jgi:hypothetical protein
MAFRTAMSGNFPTKARSGDVAGTGLAASATATMTASGTGARRDAPHERLDRRASSSLFDVNPTARRSSETRIRAR